MLIKAFFTKVKSHLEAEVEPLVEYLSGKYKMSFIRVVDTVITREIKPKVKNHQIVNIERIKDDDKTTKGVILSETEQSEYDVLYGDALQGPPG